LNDLEKRVERLEQEIEKLRNMIEKLSEKQEEYDVHVHEVEAIYTRGPESD